MTFDEEVSALRARIAKAESQRDTWRTSGMQDKYLEACSLADALELQLERLRQEGLRTSVKNTDRVPVSTPAVAPDAPGERERLMAEFSIAYNGRHYHYDRYRYDDLADAVRYAKLRPSMPPSGEEVGYLPPAEDVQAPDESQRRLMAASAITFQDGIYHLGDYRYDRLADAVNYARLRKGSEP
jgi:hypothetical protein